MRRKIRGHNRLHRQIDKWRLDNLAFDLTDYLLNNSDRYYEKIGVYPWSAISVTNSVIPEPTGKTKQKILSGLLDIYEDWKKQLDKIGQPYYLKIWLFEPRFSQSQVVCAVGDSIGFYENNFFKPDTDKVPNPENYGQLKNRLGKLNWEYRLDEDHFSNREVGEPELYASRQDFEDTERWFRKLLTKPHRTDKIDDMTEYYSFKMGDLWLVG